MPCQPAVEPALDVAIVIPAELERALEASPPLRAYAAKPAVPLGH